MTALHPQQLAFKAVPCEAEPSYKCSCWWWSEAESHPTPSASLALDRWSKRLKIPRVTETSDFQMFICLAQSYPQTVRSTWLLMLLGILLSFECHSWEMVHNMQKAKAAKGTCPFSHCTGIFRMRMGEDGWGWVRLEEAHLQLLKNIMRSLLPCGRPLGGGFWRHWLLRNLGR